jgi:outer membrane protein TolC
MAMQLFRTTICFTRSALTHAIGALTLCALTLITPALHAGTPASAGALTLDSAIRMAIEADPWLDGSRQTERALQEEAVAAGSLPDPQLSLTAVNVPVNSFDIGQEPMTQLALGFSQQFPRGRTRALSRQQKEILAGVEPLRRAERRAALQAGVSMLYLDAYQAQASRRLIEGDRGLFEQLVDAAAAQYTSAAGRARQQDLIRAQLELIRLDDRLTRLNQQQEVAQRRLAELAPGAGRMPVADRLPDLYSSAAERLLAGSATPQTLYAQLQLHPAVNAVDRRLESVATGTDLARQKYRPGFGLRAQYGYRDADPLGESRDDLLTLGITFDLPLFRAGRQDREVNAAVAREAAARTERDLLIRQLVSRLDAERAELIRLDQRRALYQERLLPQMSQQAEASLAAYNNADGDFAEAVRARIAELDAKIDSLDIDVARQQTLARINYLLVTVQAPTTAASH